MAALISGSPWIASVLEVAALVVAARARAAAGIRRARARADAWVRC